MDKGFFFLNEYEFRNSVGDEDPFVFDSVPLTSRPINFLQEYLKRYTLIADSLKGSYFYDFKNY